MHAVERVVTLSPLRELYAELAWLCSATASWFPPCNWSARTSSATNTKTPLLRAGSCLGKEPDDYLLSHGQSALSSAWSRFTVLFGMGRGGTDSLWSSGMTGCCVARVGVNLAPQPIWKKRKECGMCCLCWHNIDLKPECASETLRAAQGGASISAEALTAADTHLL